MILMEGLAVNPDTLITMTQGTTRSGVLGMTWRTTKDIILRCDRM